MEKTKIFTITKDFCSKTLSKVFVKESGDEIASISLKEKIASSLQVAKTVCFAAETALSDELMQLLINIRSQTGLRIYGMALFAHINVNQALQGKIGLFLTFLERTVLLVEKTKSMNMFCFSRNVSLE